jgi:hypothetical protein
MTSMACLRADDITQACGGDDEIATSFSTVNDQRLL